MPARTQGADAVPRSSRASHVAAVAVLTLLGLVAVTAPAHAAGTVDRAPTRAAAPVDRAPTRAALDRDAAAVGPGVATTSRVVVADAPDADGRESRTGASDDREHLTAAIAHVVDDVVGAVHRTRCDVAASLAFQRHAVAAWWSASAPAWVRDAARVGPALWDLGRSVADLMRSQAVQWLSWITDDARVATR